MNSTPADWQSIIALTIVALTIVLFIARALRNRGKTSCGGGCDCSKPKAR